MKKYIGIALAIVVLAIGIAIAKLAQKPNTNSAQNTSGQKLYCSSEGMLTTEKPIQSHRSYCLNSDADNRTYNANVPFEYSFSIVDDQGSTLKDFEVSHTKTMHVIAARKDLANFQHVHPEFNQQTGSFTLSNLTLPTDGQYRIFADFVPNGGQLGADGIPLPVTLSQDIVAGGDYNPQQIGSEEKTKVFDGYQVTLSSDQALTSGKEVMLNFDLKQNGRPISDLQEYLGALGHSVILREGSLDFIHTHPMEQVTAKQNGRVSFMVTFPQTGKYKVFTQFQRNGKVTTTDFVVSIQQGQAQEQMNMEEMDMGSMGH